MKFCPKCGTEVPGKGLLYCQNCGYKLTGEYNIKSNKHDNDDNSKGLIGGFLKGIRKEIEDNETLDDMVTHAKIIWHGPKSEKEKAYKERKRQEEEKRDPINYKISEVTGKHFSDSPYFTERKRLFNVTDGYTYYKDILKFEVNNNALEYEDIEARLDELLKINDARTLFELRLKKPTYLFKTHEDLDQYIGYGTAKNPIPISDREIEKITESGLDRSAALKKILSKGTNKKDVGKIRETKQVDNITNQETEKPQVMSVTKTTKKESFTKQKTDEPNYNDFELSDLQKSLIKTLPIISNPSDYEENIINKYAEYNSDERKELLKDCWTVTKLANEHNIKRQEVQKAILVDEFLDKDLIGVFKINPNNIRSLKILYRKPLEVEQQKQEIKNLSTNEEIIEGVNEVPIEESIDEKIEDIEEVQIEEQIKETIKQPVETFQEENINASSNVNHDNKKDNNKKKEKKSIGRKIMDFNLGRTIMDKGLESLEEEKREVREKISPLLPEYAKMLNTTPDKLYVTYIADTYIFRGTKHTSMNRDGVVMYIGNTMISYIVFGKIIGFNITFYDTADIYSISFKNIISITDKKMNIELKMTGDSSINILYEDYFGKRFLNELLEKYNKFNMGSNVTENNTSHNETSNADELLKYAELYKQGLLTEEEFEAKKKELL